MAKGFKLLLTREKLKTALEADLPPAKKGQKIEYTDGRVEQVYQALKAYRLGRPTEES